MTAVGIATVIVLMVSLLLREAAAVARDSTARHRRRIRDGDHLLLWIVGAIAVLPTVWNLLT